MPLRCSLTVSYVRDDIGFRLWGPRDLRKDSINMGPQYPGLLYENLIQVTII